MLPTEVTLIPNYIIMRSFPLLGGNDITGAGGHGMLNSYWGLIAPNVASVFGSQTHSSSICDGASVNRVPSPGCSAGRPS